MFVWAATMHECRRCQVIIHRRPFAIIDHSISSTSERKKEFKKCYHMICVQYGHPLFC